MKTSKKIVLFFIVLIAIVSIGINYLELNSNLDISTVSNESLYNSPIVDFSLSKDSVKFKEKFKFKGNIEKTLQDMNSLRN